jgi:hypothetical protein
MSNANLFRESGAENSKRIVYGEPRYDIAAMGGWNEENGCTDHGTVRVGFGHIVALWYHWSTLHQIF